MGGVIVAQYAFGFNDRQMAMFRTVFILNILQIRLLVLGSTERLIFRINIHDLSHFLNDHSFRKPSRLCDQMWSITVIGVTSAYYWEYPWWANFTAKYKSSFHWVFFLAEAHIMPSKWLRMLLNTAIAWRRVSVWNFNIDTDHYQNSLKLCVSYLTMYHSLCVVKSSCSSLHFGFSSH